MHDGIYIKQLMLEYSYLQLVLKYTLRVDRGYLTEFIAYLIMKSKSKLENRKALKEILKFRH